jgi:Putative prokaryotic signal transducing protein
VIPMQRLTWVSGSFRAHVVRARLQSEGIDAELRGAVDGPYLLTVGDMARVDVYVPTDQMEDAQLVLLAGEVDTALAAPREWGGTKKTPSVWARAAALASLGAAIAAPVVLYFRFT